jgi:hypothetical protein
MATEGPNQSIKPVIKTVTPVAYRFCLDRIRPAELNGFPNFSRGDPVGTFRLTLDGVVKRQIYQWRVVASSPQEIHGNSSLCIASGLGWLLQWAGVLRDLVQLVQHH